MNVAVRMSAISKKFGPVQALENIDLTVETGTIHALVGENGAGKTTLMNVLYGRFPATEGTYEVEGQSRSFPNSAAAIRAGIGMVSQHYAIIPELSCLQNLILGAEPGPLLHPAELQAKAQILADRMGFSFDWKQNAGELSPAAAQKLEILKLLWRDSRILILDEPTAMLSPQDSDALYESLKQLASQGATVIVVTHRLPEVMDHCRRATILRGGKKVGDVEVEATNEGELTRLIVGHDVLRPEPRDVPPGEVVLRVRDLVLEDYRGHEILRGANFEVRQGEILGLVGVDGNGQRELFATLLGTQKPKGGTIDFPGRTPAERLAAGLVVIPEDRHAQAIVEDWSLTENSALGRQRQAPFAKGIWVDREGREKASQAIAERFSTRFGSLTQPIRGLSGGNQQRFVNGRALAGNPRLVLAFSPARGLDIEATRRFYEGLREACAQGAAALVVSFDLDELLVYADRRLVLNAGQVFSPENDRDRAEVGRLMVATS